jgi:hypothetical protein
VLVLEGPGDTTVIAEKHLGSAAPRGADETQRLREAVTATLSR